MTRRMRPAGGAKLRAHLVERTRFFDQQVLAAIAAGIGQVVILGAGYDDRALRFASPGVRFFEVDQRQTQADKRRRLERLGADFETVVLVAADFRSDDAATALAGAGHDATARSLFICEGLLIYLDEATNVSLLAALRERAAPRSRLAASLAVHRDGEDSAVVVADANARRRHSDTEPWLTILPAAGQLALLARAGWAVIESSSPIAGMLCAVAEPVA
jgi:methyltransferase (TIGR00027 family)